MYFVGVGFIRPVGFDESNPYITKILRLSVIQRSEAVLNEVKELERSFVSLRTGSESHSLKTSAFTGHFSTPFTIFSVCVFSSAPART